MEHTTPFNLNLAIQHWRDNLAQSLAVGGEDLRELEAHLRDSIAALQARELSDEEAFLVATRRMGRRDALAAEFGKVNPGAFWIDRFLWLLIGFQAWRIFWSGSSIVGSFVSFATVSFSKWLGVNQVSHQTIREGSFLFGQSLALIAAGVICWLWLVRRGKVAGSSSSGLLHRPGALSLTLLLVSVGLSVAATWTLTALVYPENYSRSIGLPQALWGQIVHLPGYLLLLLFTFFVARRRLKIVNA